MIQIIGWTILHSLWKIALLASLYLLIKNNWRTKTALKKYYLAVSALVTTFLSTIFTCSYLYQQENWMVTPITDGNLIPIISETSTTTLIPVQPNEIVVETTITLADYLTICLPYLVAFWGLGMLYFTIRFLKNLYGVKQLQNIDNELISREWLAKIKIFKTQLNIQKDVQVFLSLHIKEPITFGHFKPIILLPISLITGFDTAAIETILLHELAHIKRHDYLVNLGQSFIEIILFYHPLIWWLSKDIRELREHCCDDLVLSLGDNRITYVETLTALQWRKVGGVTNRLSLSASGGDAGFSRRIKRMFGVEEKRGSFRQLMGVFLVLLVVAVGISFYNSIEVRQLIFRNETGSFYPNKTFTYILDENTTMEEMRAIQKEIKVLGITMHNFCMGTSTTYYDEDTDNSELIKNINGSYFREGGQEIFFDSPNLAEHPIQLTFNNKFLSKSKVLPKDDLGLLINEKTTEKELLKWAIKLAKLGIDFKYEESVFDKDGQITELRGSFKGNQSGGYFFAANTDCINVKFKLEEDRLLLPEYLYPCGENELEMENSKNDTSNRENVMNEPLSILIISKRMNSQDLFKSVDEFNEMTNSRVIFNDLNFDMKDQLIGEIRGSIRPNKSGVFHFFEIHDIDKYSVQLQANTDTIIAPKYIINETNQTIAGIGNEAMKNSKIKINNQTTKADLVNWANQITKHGIVFNFEKSIFDKEEKLLGLNAKFNGKCCFNDAFFISNLEEVEVHLEVKDNYIYQPTVITQTEDGVEELKARFWSEAVERTWINPEKDDELWKMESLRKMKIISNGKDISPSLLIPNLQEEAQYKNWLDTISKRSKENRFKQIKQEYEIGLLESKNGKERAVWEQKLEELAKIEQYSNVIPNNQFKSKTTENSPLSYKINNWKALGLDSTAYELKKKYENDRGNSIAQLIPPYVAVDDSVRAMNPIYRANTEKAKSVFVNGQKIAKKDLPTFMENQLQKAIKIDSPKTKRYPKTDTTVDWLYWGDQQINLGEAYKKEENGTLKWDVPKLQISKEVWDNNKDRPFIFQIDGNWYRVKDLEMAVLVPYKGDPASVNFHKDYAKALKNKEGSVFKIT